MAEKFDVLDYTTKTTAPTQNGILTKLINISKRGSGDGVDTWTLRQADEYLNGLYAQGYRVVAAQAFDTPDSLSVFYVLQLK